jgi:hypothetical protein
MVRTPAGSGSQSDGKIGVNRRQSHVFSFSRAERIARRNAQERCPCAGSLEQLTMSEPLPVANSPRQPAVDSAGRKRHWLRLGAILLLAQMTLFYQGCDHKYLIHSLGPAGPWITFGIDESLLSSKLMDFSPVLLGINLLLIAAVVLVVARLGSPWFERLTSRSLLAATAIATLIFNSILYFAGVWIHLVALPVNWLAEVIFSADSARSAVVHGTLARVYYFVVVATIAGTLRFVQWLLRRYLFIHADRWQVSLGGLLTIMAILGTGIGLLLRFFVS